MDDETLKALELLREVNETLIMGLEGAVDYMERYDKLTPEERLSIIEKLKALIAESHKFYGLLQTRH